MIHFSNVTKHYPGHGNVLDHVSFTIHAGERVFITGPSGAGKTTLLKLILCVESHSSGLISLSQNDIRQLKPSQLPYLRRQIGMITQNPQLIAERTVFENVALPMVMVGYSQQEIVRRVRAALDKVGLKDKEVALPRMLSDGEIQRVGIARAVVNKPVILLADEPTGNLDPEMSMDIMQLFEQFNAVGVTVLVVTHDVSLARSLGWRFLTLRSGCLVSDEGKR